MKTIKKYYPFWLGLIGCLILSVLSKFSILIILPIYIAGYFYLISKI